MIAGDGNGKNTHVSLFFVVMKGDFDALLPWPFQQKVTFHKYCNTVYAAKFPAQFKKS